MDVVGSTDIAPTSTLLDSGQINMTVSLVLPHPPGSPDAIAETVTLILIMVASFFANLVAMTQIMTSPKLRKVHHNLLILNLSIIDMGITLFSMPFSVAALFDNGNLLINNSLVCTINGFCAMTCTVGNFTNVMCIAVDRYISIVWSTRFLPTRRRMVFMIAFIWAISVSIALPPTFEFLSSFEYTSQTHHCSPMWDVCSYYSIWFTFIFGVTVPVMIFCYVCVIFYIRKTERQLRKYGGSTSKNGKGVVRKKTFDNNDEGTFSTLHIDNSSCVDPCPQTNDAVMENDAHDENGTHDENDVRDENDTHDKNEIVVNVFLNGTFEGEEQYTDGFQVIEMTQKEVAVLQKDSPLFSISAEIARETDVTDECTPKTYSDKRKVYSGEVSPKRHGYAQRSVSITSRRQLINGTKVTARQSRLSVDKRVACTGAMLVLTTIFCWTPYSAIHFCYSPIDVTHPVAVTSMWIAYLNSLLDPLVYVFMNRTESTRQYLSGILTAIRAAPARLWRYITCSMTRET